MKKCHKCGELKPLIKFKTEKGYHPHCIDCRQGDEGDVLICEICGDEFYKKEKAKNQKYCLNGCADVGQIKKQSEYKNRNVETVSAYERRYYRNKKREKASIE